ncbi:DUF4350 domain-containing protein [Microbacteriaceae bacterium 4G12]
MTAPDAATVPRPDAGPRAGASPDDDPTPGTGTAVAASLTVRAWLRRGAFWFGAAGFVLVVVVIAALVNGVTGATGGPLDADNPAPRGGMAVAEVLQQRGVEVLPVDTLEEAEDAAAGPGETTLLLNDRDALLTDEQLQRAGGIADRLVLASPEFSVLQALAPGVLLAGSSGDDRALTARCADPAATAGESIRADGLDAYRVDDATLPAGAQAAACFPAGDGAVALVRLVDGDRETVVVDADPLFTNDQVGRSGNAAVALTALGSRPTLVWYTPGLGDVEVTGPPSLAELTPGWVTPLALLLGIVALAAALWRGRRFGPLVVEDLPVTVRASETMEGRARLYQRASARGRALDALRVGAVSRMATSLGLGRAASVQDVIAAAAAATGTDPGEVHAVVLGALPATDRELVTLTDRLRALEADVTDAVDPTGGRTT